MAANESRAMMMKSEGVEEKPVCPLLVYWKGVSRTALLKGFKTSGSNVITAATICFQQKKLNLESTGGNLPRP